MKVKKQLGVIWSLFLAIVIIQSCRNDAKENTIAELSGRWELAWAQVDGTDTDRLRNLYFVFLPDSSFQSNIFGTEANFKYRMEGNVIHQISQPPLDYTLEAMNDSMLTLKTEIRGSAFTIHMDRSRPKLRSQN